jgi:hypothetical protein
MATAAFFSNIGRAVARAKRARAARWFDIQRTRFAAGDKRR